MSQVDGFSKERCKSRYIIELRYEPLVQMFDRRGKLLEILHPEFQKKAKRWKTENAHVMISNELEGGTIQLAVGHMSCSISYEDPGSLGEFVDDSRKFIKLLKKVFPEGFYSFSRIGFRVVSIFRHPKYSTFADANISLMNGFLKPLSTPLEFSDFRLTLVRESCQLNIGPVKEGELWVKQAFVLPEKNMPKAGIGLDIDSFGTDIKCKNEDDLLQAIATIQGLAFKIEEDLMRPLLSEQKA